MKHAPIYSHELASLVSPLTARLRRERPEIFSGGWDVRLDLRASLGDDAIEAVVTRARGAGRTCQYQHAMGVAEPADSPNEMVDAIIEAVRGAALLLVPMKPAGRWRLFGRSVHA